MTLQTTPFFTFGEMLWDCLPSGRHAGGAPFNVAAHLSQLEQSAFLLSAVGPDALGEELLAVARDKNIDTRFVTLATVPTGIVQATLDAHSNATYDIVQPAAWDTVMVSPEAQEAVKKASALIYGSLAARSSYNRDELDALLEVSGPMKCFDVNLRPPFVDPGSVMHLAHRADLVKLNDDEIGRLASWLQTGTMTPQPMENDAALIHACSMLAQATETPLICVTRGASGALLWAEGRIFSASAPPVEVRDTVGAGDAFMAALIVGLTQDADRQKVVENACRVGAFVAGHYGATPLLPPEIVAAVNQVS